MREGWIQREGGIERQTERHRWRGRETNRHDRGSEGRYVHTVDKNYL